MAMVIAMRMVARILWGEEKEKPPTLSMKTDNQTGPYKNKKGDCNYSWIIPAGSWEL